MQVTETNADGLKREYKITVPASEIEGRISTRLTDLGRQIKMPGFRPGKVPVSLLRKQHGKRVLGEVLEDTVNEGSRQAISTHELRPALRPKIEVTSFDEGADLEFTMAVEVLPEVPEIELKAIALERPKAEVGDEEVGEALARMAKSRTQFTPVAEPRPAQDGDRVVVDFEGKIDGVPFEGGKAEDAGIVLGSNSLIPGFEAGLVGKSAGDETTLDVTFPEDYPSAEVKGKAATFDVTVKAIEAPSEPAVDDDLAKLYGAEGLDDLKGKVREQLEQQYAQAGRAKVKRKLLDHLAETQSFPVPEGMVDLEFETIWQQLTEEMKQSGETFEGGEKSEEETRAEYRRIAERRVRLGLILSDIGTENKITVEQNELQQALFAQVRRFPGQEREVFEFFQKNPQAMEQLRAPLFEDKVVDFILQLATITDVPVSKEELFKEEPDEAAVA
ncbi:trigger factor [Marinivivus vitaminiproducens]|uniref:trigger factor n=1 Tax=Marinivivus vitaminiproducens TaxID=3035935 RepID=UPI002797DEF2|nr:trigger factor [Geminicoccaceae bacterium SCSIO 64248]